MPTPIITDGSMDSVKEAPKVVLPSGLTALFRLRADRFLALSRKDQGSMGPYLALMADLCQAQSHWADKQSPVAVDSVALEHSRLHGMPPMADLVFNRPSGWQADLRGLVSHVLEKGSVNDAVRASLNHLQQCTEQSDHGSTKLESLADAVLAGVDLAAEDARLVPFIGAALQLHFARLAASLSAEDLRISDTPGVCPCCGSRPTASIIHMDPQRLNSRYLVCSVCLTEWNMERVKCTNCYKEGGVAYLLIDDSPTASQSAAIRAETCDDCKSYLKIFVEEKDPMLDVIADDLSSLALDLLVHERGYARTGPNLLLYPGDQ